MRVSPGVSLFILFFIVFSTVGFSQKTDTLYLKNGDRYIGEVKGLKYGKLTYKTSAASTLSIKWTHVDTLISNKYYRIKFENGSEWYGQFDSTFGSNALFQIFSALEDDFTQEHISELVPVKNTFLARIDGSVDIGYSYTKASDVTNFNLGGSISYRARSNFTQLKYSGITTVEGRDDRTNRKQDLNLQYMRFHGNNWISQGFGAYEQNLELGLQGRVIGGVAFGYNFFETNHAFWVVTTGPMYSYEQPTSEDESTRENWEAIIISQLKLFSFSQPNVSLDLSTSLIPSFTVEDRVRANIDSKFKWEIFNDFYWNWSFYYTYDNKPVSEEGATNDYGITTGVSLIF